jgi:hypothetical protein
MALARAAALWLVAGILFLFSSLAADHVDLVRLAHQAAGEARSQGQTSLPGR